MDKLRTRDVDALVPPPIIAAEGAMGQVIGVVLAGSRGAEWAGPRGAWSPTA
jgi:hypothetical protein